MGKKTIAIDIGTKNIHVVEGVNHGDFVEVTNAFMMETPPNAHQDGRLEDRGSMLKALMEGMKENHINAKEASITIHSSSVAMKELTMPMVKMDELTNLVNFEMYEYLANSAENSIIEYKILKEVAEGDKKSYKIRSAAMPKEIMESYYRFLQSAKLSPVSLDIHPNAISKLLTADAKINGRPMSKGVSYVFVDIGHRGTMLNFISEGVLELSRNISTGTMNIYNAYMSSGTSIDGNMEKDGRNARSLDLSTMSTGEVDNMLQPMPVQWSTEMQRVCQYYTNRLQGSKIEALYLHGGGAFINGMDVYLHKALGVEVKKIETISTVHFKVHGHTNPYSNPNDQRIMNYLNAAGTLITWKRGK